MFLVLFIKQCLSVAHKMQYSNNVESRQKCQKSNSSGDFKNRNYYYTMKCHKLYIKLCQVKTLKKNPANCNLLKINHIHCKLWPKSSNHIVTEILSTCLNLQFTQIVILNCKKLPMHNTINIYSTYQWNLKNKWNSIFNMSWIFVTRH